MFDLIATLPVDCQSPIVSRVLTSATDCRFLNFDLFGLKALLLHRRCQEAISTAAGYGPSARYTREMP